MPAVARKGDSNVPHCSGHSVQSASGDVFVNGRGAARKGDKCTTHVVRKGKKCKPHSASIKRGSGSVFVNGRPVARVGDGYSGCTSIARGSSNVFAS
jgi:uncharacterized Zn-binding protein involved in type VI secretion